MTSAEEGRLIGNKWRVIRLLGRGAMGRVYEVRHKQLPLRKALKQLHPELAEDPAIEKRFVDEARRGAALDHPNIVRVADIDFEEGAGPYIVMDLVEGETLGERLKNGDPFDYPTVLRIGSELASALDCAHRLGVIHRDVKPANILLESGTGCTKLTDFGIAKQVGEKADATVTGTGLYVGTVRYSSGEQLRNTKGVTIDGRADIYSLGVVLYEMVSGRKYLEGCSEFEIASRVGFDPEWLPDLGFDRQPPENFRRLLQSCLAGDREDRMASATDLIAALEACRLSSESTPETDATVALGDAPTRLVPAAAQKLPQQQPGTAFNVERLQKLRAELNHDAAEYGALIQALKDLGRAPTELLQLDDISQMLRRVEESEGRGELAEGQRDLGGVRDTLLEASDSIRALLAEEVRSRMEEVHEGWTALGEHSAEAAAQHDDLIARLRRAQSSQDWSGSTALLREAEEHLAAAGTPSGPTQFEALPLTEEDVVPLTEPKPPRRGLAIALSLAIIAGVAVAYIALVGPTPFWPAASRTTAEKPTTAAQKTGPTDAERAAFEDHIKIARFFLDRGDYPGATLEIDQALAIHPADPTAIELKDAVLRAQRAEDSILGGNP